MMREMLLKRYKKEILLALEKCYLILPSRSGVRKGFIKVTVRCILKFD